MEEVDRLVIHALRQVGLNRLSASETSPSTLNELTVDDVLEAASRCLMFIDPTLDLPLRMPPNMAARFRIGTKLADAVRQAGFPGEIGYQTFMYLNAADVRALLLFLVEALPKDKAEFDSPVDDDPDAASRLRRQATAAIAADLGRIRVPGAVRPPWDRSGVVNAGEDPLGVDYRPWGLSMKSRTKEPFIAKRISVPNASVGKIDPSSDEYFYLDEIMPWFWQQTERRSVLASSLLEANALRLVAMKAERESGGMANAEPRKGRKDKMRYNVKAMLTESINEAKSVASPEELLPALKESTGNKATPVSIATSLKSSLESVEDSSPKRQVDVKTHRSEEEILAAREATLADIRAEIESAAHDNDQLSTAVVSVVDSKRIKEIQIAELARSARAAEDVCERGDKLAALLPDVSGSVDRLESAIAASQQRMVRLQEQWNAVRSPLEEEIRALADRSGVKGQVTAALEEEATVAADKYQRVKEDLVKKESSIKTLAKELEKAPKDPVSRTSFTKRILEIIANIKKQKGEMDRILGDTKNLQKDINALNGRLERSFVVVDEVVFRDAKKDEAVRKAYKLLASLHESCASLISAIEEIGSAVRATRDVEDAIEREEGLGMEANLQQITKDLESMRKENAELSPRGNK